MVVVLAVAGVKGACGMACRFSSRTEAVGDVWRLTAWVDEVMTAMFCFGDGEWVAFGVCGCALLLGGVLECACRDISASLVDCTNCTGVH